MRGFISGTSFWIERIADLSVVCMTQMFPSHADNVRGPLRTLSYTALAD